jgi:hypothetical protein
MTTTRRREDRASTIAQCVAAEPFLTTGFYTRNTLLVGHIKGQKGQRMRRGLALWLLLLAVASVGAVVTYTRCPGCIPRDRVNKSCEWTDDARFPLDPRNPAHREHLVEDAQLAEELAIRYADTEFGRRSGGIEHHGGLLDNGRVRRDCLSRMFHAIEDNHGVTSDQIRVARGERNRTFDLAVVLLFLPVYSLGATIACRRLFRRFSSNERFVGFIATALSSIAAAFLGLQALRLWGGLWEAVRVGNGHMTSIRAASSTRWIQFYVGADFIGGLLLFWIIALICYRVVSKSGDEPATDAHAPHGLLLR